MPVSARPGQQPGRHQPCVAARRLANWGSAAPAGLLQVAVAVVAQAVPGPLFSFSAFLGASMQSAPNGWIGAVLCLLAIYIPSFLLVIGVLPFWEQLRHSIRMQAAFAGVNAAVVGLLLATLYRPV